jgi:hypothetical protein
MTYGLQSLNKEFHLFCKSMGLISELIDESQTPESLTITTICEEISSDSIEEKEIRNCSVCNIYTREYQDCFKCHSLVCDDCCYGKCLPKKLDFRYYCTTCKDIHHEEFINKES